MRSVGTGGRAFAPLLARAAQAASGLGWSPPAGSQVRCQVVTFPEPLSTAIVRSASFTLPPSDTVTPGVELPLSHPTSSAGTTTSARATRRSPVRPLMTTFASLPDPGLPRVYPAPAPRYRHPPATRRRPYGF